VEEERGVVGCNADMPLLSVAEYGGNFFSTLVDEFVETYVRRKTRGWSETDRLLKREFVNLWAPGLSRSISRQGVTKVLNAIVKRGSPSAGNHALAAVSKMFNWAIEHGHLDRSPCLGIKAPSKLKSRDRVLTDEELVRIWLAAPKMRYPYGSIIQLLILTARRRNEVTGMRWVEMDLMKATWTIPASLRGCGLSFHRFLIIISAWFGQRHAQCFAREIVAVWVLSIWTPKEFRTMLRH